MNRIGLSILAICGAAAANAQSFSPDDLARRTVERRAVEAVIWGMPAVNFDLMYQAMARGQRLVEPGRLLVAAARLEEPDADAQSRRDLPHALLQHEGRRADGDGDSAGGSRRLDHRQHRRCLADRAGRCRARRRRQGRGRQISDPAARLQGQGARRLHRAAVADLSAATRLLRSNLTSGSAADVAKAVAYGKRVKFYPLSQAANPPPTTFVDAIDVVFDSTIPYDLRFFQSLDRFVQHEPWLERDKAMIDMLKSIGIEKGKTFDPDQKTQAILKDAIAEAHAWLDNRYEGVFATPSMKDSTGRCRPRRRSPKA